MQERRHLNQSEIAAEIGIARQYVSVILKSSLRRVYKATFRQGIAKTPFEAFEKIAYLMGIEEQININELFKELPDDIKEEIRKDAEKTFM